MIPIQKISHLKDLVESDSLDPVIFAEALETSPREIDDYELIAVKEGQRGPIAVFTVHLRHNLEPQELIATFEELGI